jgi:phage repressor protein C with HTH and peptisase S24 domain
MIPTLRSGDAVIVRKGARVRPGQVVVARFRDRPELLVVKRAVRPYEGGWYLAADNPFAVGDSSVHGPADVVGRVVLRYWPRPRWPLPAAPDARAVQDFPP